MNDYFDPNITVPDVLNIETGEILTFEPQPIGVDYAMQNSYSAYELRVHDVLRKWFNALEDGTVEHLLPDPHYERPSHKRPWTDSDLETLIKVIDDYVWEQRNWAEGTHKKAFDEGPGFNRLQPPQRLAFAQELEQALRSN